MIYHYGLLTVQTRYSNCRLRDVLDSDITKITITDHIISSIAIAQREPE